MSYTLHPLIVLTTSELHHSIIYIKDSQHVLQEHIAQDIGTGPAVSNARHAESTQRISRLAHQQVFRIQPEGRVVNDHGNAGRHGVAGREVAANEEVQLGGGFECAVDGLSEL